MANILVPLINGKSYEYADIIMNVLGVPIIGVTSIEYEDVQEMENIYGAGKYPVSRGYGKVVPTAKITLLMEEVEAIQAAVIASPWSRIQDIPEFDITITYLDAALVPVNHAIRNVRFMDNNRKSNTGDTSIPVEMSLIISHIDWAA